MCVGKAHLLVELWSQVTRTFALLGTGQLAGLLLSSEFMVCKSGMSLEVLELREVRPMG